MRPWHFHWARVMVNAGAAAAGAGICLASISGGAKMGQVLVSARQLFGLWALGFLLASLLLGPLTSLLPWIPARSSLLYARRAVGVAAFCLALAHVGCYLGSLALRNWRELYTPGAMWIAGLILGGLALLDLAILSVTSRDAAVKRMGGRRWKRLHKTVYVALGVVLLHALLTGADFGLNRGPDVRGDPDAGAGVTFLCLSVAWIVLFMLRGRRVTFRGVRRGVEGVKRAE